MNFDEGVNFLRQSMRVIEGDSSVVVHKKILELQNQGWLLVSDMAERLMHDDACFVAVMRAPKTKPNS
jgi:hypothetical protein